MKQILQKIPKNYCKKYKKNIRKLFIKHVFLGQNTK